MADVVAAHVPSEGVTEFYTRLSDIVLLLSFVAPVLSCLYYGAVHSIDTYLASSKAGSGENGSKLTA